MFLFKVPGSGSSSRQGNERFSSDIGTSTVGSPTDDRPYFSDRSDGNSVGSIDHLTEDINTLSINQPIGFMGRGSEVAWLKLLMAQLNIADEQDNLARFSGSTGGVACAPRNMSELVLTISVP